MIQRDKILHFTVNLIATVISVCIFLINPILLVPMLAIGLSIGKEYGDSKAQGNYWSWGDILADGIGIVVAILACLLIGAIL